MSGGSTQTIVLNDGSTLHVQYDVSKIFIRSNRYDRGTLLNNTGSTASFLAGTLLGRVATTGNLVPLASGTGTNGENIPVGILAEDVTDLANAGTVSVAFCIEGDVAEDKVLFQGADDLTTVVANRRLGDRIQGDTKGIKLVASTELTRADNS